ncbi:MAG: hypothetical protein KDC14_05400 [Planctomycetes bacterium]|nr:hypothetical protein [Planctomycetota bacterium]
MNELEEFWGGTYCWKIGCSTCGCRELREGMRRIGGETGYVDPRTSTPVSVQRSLLRMASWVDYRSLSAEQSDWLGYLGVLLFDCESVERQEHIATPALVSSLLEMMPAGSREISGLELFIELRKPLTWWDLGRVETLLGPVVHN